MSETADMWKGVKEKSQKKRAKNRERGAELLEEHGIIFTEHNGGAHLIIEDRWDYWPGTGKWLDRRVGMYDRGIMKLIKTVKAEIKPEDTNDDTK